MRSIASRFGRLGGPGAPGAVANAKESSSGLVAIWKCLAASEPCGLRTDLVVVQWPPFAERRSKVLEGAYPRQQGAFGRKYANALLRSRYIDSRERRSNDGAPFVFVERRRRSPLTASMPAYGAQSYRAAACEHPGD